MKKFRISYSICEGDHKYADEMIVEAERLTRRQAAGHVWEFFTYDPNDKEEKRGFVYEIKDGGFCMIDGDYRGIKDLYVEEIRPVIVTVEGGRILSIDNIPRDIVIEVRDFDVDDPTAPSVRKSGESGDPYLESVWENR
jgi:hypothetical protein